MKTDITTEQDIRRLVELFYDRVKRDDLLALFFGPGSSIDWTKHLEVMTRFWENAVFYNGSYQGNPMQTHRHLHKYKPFTRDHFKQWVFLFATTVDELFEGSKADQVKQKAKSIAAVMEIKITSEQP